MNQAKISKKECSIEPVMEYLIDLREEHQKYKQIKKKVLLVELNNCHGECLPGYIKYFQDLNYTTDVMLNKRQKEEQPLYLFDNLNIQYLSFKSIFNYLNSNAPDQYDIIFINSNFLYHKGLVSSLIRKKYRKAKKLYVEHRLENLSVLAQGTTPIVLKKFPISGFSFEVNPHYFGKIKIHKKNKIINFITVGNIETKRKNHNILVSCVQKLVNQGITNFKITIIGRGTLDIISPNIQSYFDIKGYLTHPQMHQEVQKADYFLPLLDPENDDHIRYLSLGTSGSFQLIHGFNIPCLIAERFAKIHGFNMGNSIIYKQNDQLSDAMLTAINLPQKGYAQLKSELKSYSEKIYAISLKNLNSAIIHSSLIHSEEKYSFKLSIPVFMYTKKSGQLKVKLFGLPIFKIKKKADKSAKRLFIFGLPILKIKKNQCKTIKKIYLFGLPIWIHHKK